MNRSTGAVVVLAAAAFAQDAQAKKSLLKDLDVGGSWIYDDLGAGYAQAQKKAKPMLVVLR